MHRSSSTKSKPAAVEVALSPFCCNNTIPASFRHLIDILPQSTTHFALARPLSSAPILASFLSYVVAPTPPLKRDKTAGNTYFAIVQVTRVSLGVEDNQKDKTKNTNEDFFDQDLSLHLKSATDEQNDILDRQDIVEIISGENAHMNDSVQRYYIAIERSGENTILDQECKVMGKAWREVDKSEAESRTNATGWVPTLGGIEQRQHWLDLDGVEKLWCEDHQVKYEMRVWIREH